jgi:hypothetical protein
MPYALFTNDEQISKAYRTKQEVWKKADEAGLVVDAPSAEDHHPPRVLDEDYQIKCCPPDTPTGEVASSSDSTPIRLIQTADRLRSHR